MRSLLGFFLLGISFFGTLFFRNYQGGMIAHPVIFYSICLMIGMVGAWCVFSVKISRQEREIQAHEERVEEFKKKSDFVPLDIDRCEFKNGSFQQELMDSKSSMLDLEKTPSSGALQLTLLNKKSVRHIKNTEEILRSYLVYRTMIGNREFSYISQAFPFDDTTLEFHVMNKDVSLYVDRLDKTKYLFVLIR